MHDRHELSDDDLWAEIDRLRGAFADLLASLAPEQWERPSLCAGWRVREVAAHLALSAPSFGWALAALVRARFSFNALIDQTARAHAAATTPDQLVAQIHGLAGSRRRAPGTNRLDPLLDVLVHTQDVARPLGITVPMPAPHAAAAAGLAWDRSFPFNARSRHRGLRLVATDIDWERGAGRTVEAPMSTILLALTGRTDIDDHATAPRERP